MKILTFTTLFPNAVQKRHGIFVENRLRHLLESGQVESRVVAPVPWFPLKSPRFGAYSQFARVERIETRNGVVITHPRYPVIPKVGMSLAPWIMAHSVMPAVKKIIREGYDFDMIDAHYFYPDGVAAAWLAKQLGKPLVITARGSDLNLIPQYRVPRTLIQWAARRASGMITVCQALKDVLVELGVEAKRVTVLRNGVDLDIFRPAPQRQVLRERLGIRRETLLSIGNLVKMKGHDLVIRALQELPEMELLIAGDGEEEVNLKRLAVEIGVMDRVRFLGTISHNQLQEYYAAVDVLILASSREGWANVLLESMACGTPVVATRVGGTPEVVAAPESGVLIKHRDSVAIAKAVNELLDDYPDREAVRRYAEQFSWDATTQGQLDLFSQILGVVA